MSIQLPRRELDKNGDYIWIHPPQDKASVRKLLQARIADATEKLTARFPDGSYCYCAEAREWAAKRLPELQSELDATGEEVSQ